MTNAKEQDFVCRINENGIGPNLLREVFNERGWKVYDEEVRGKNTKERWNLWWRTKGFPVFQCHTLDETQFTNHIPNAIFICKKDNLVRCLKCMRKIYGSFYNFVPVSFNLPLEYKKFLSTWKFKLPSDLNKKDAAVKQVWICKPVGLSQGRGISLFQNPRDLVYDSNAVVQKYIENPLLIGGYKFDLRLYVLVPSFHPFTVYVYCEGLVRFGTEKFTLNNLKNRFAHLTNCSLNKFGPGYLEMKEQIGAGCKWSLRQLRCYLRQTIRSDWLLWQNIATMIVLTLASQLSRVPHTNNCFELYGFDVLIDGALKPWLIEVNSSPALSVDCEIDVEIKKPMIHDLFDLLGLPIRNIDLLTPSTKCWHKRGDNCRYSNSLMRAVSKWKRKQTKNVVVQRGQKTKETHFRAWGNGKDWNFPETRVGNWVCVFPILASHQRWPAKRTTPINSSEIRRTFSTEEIRSVVCSATLFQKLAKDTFERHFDAETDELNLFMSKYLRVDSQLWSPPL